MPLALRLQTSDAFLGTRRVECRMHSTRDIAWLAGLLEGEGCFSKRGNCITIQLYMSDRDVVERAGWMMGALSVGRYEGKSPKHKTCYYITVSGPNAAAWMMTLYTLLGARRQARIRELLEVFRRAKMQKPSSLVCPHTDQHRRHRLVCDRCYKKHWVQTKKGGEARYGSAVAITNV